MVGRLNRMVSGWANYFNLGQVKPAYEAVDQHAVWRLRQWFCRKHKVREGKYVRFPSTWLWEQCGLTRLARTTSRERRYRHSLDQKCGLTRLARTTRYLPWAKA